MYSKKYNAHHIVFIAQYTLYIVHDTPHNVNIPPARPDLPVSDSKGSKPQQFPLWLHSTLISAVPTSVQASTFSAWHTKRHTKDLRWVMGSISSCLWFIESVQCTLHMTIYKSWIVYWTSDPCQHCRTSSQWYVAFYRMVILVYKEFSHEDCSRLLGAWLYDSMGPEPNVLEAILRYTEGGGWDMGGYWVKRCNTI